MSKEGAAKASANLKPSPLFIKGHSIKNTGRTRFKQGHINSEAVKEKVRQALILRNKTDNPVWKKETRQKISITLTGSKIPTEVRIKMSFAQRGEKGSNWQGGKTKEQEERQLAEYREWRRDVFERDDYTCQNCFKRGGEIEAHHIEAFSKQPAKRTDIDNGMTLCAPCHKELHKKRVVE